MSTFEFFKTLSSLLEAYALALGRQCLPTFWPLLA